MEAKCVIKTTKSLCPICLNLVEAEVLLENGKVMIEKQCPEHGMFKDTYWSDSELFMKFEKFAHDGNGVENPHTNSLKGCPFDCGLCPNHKTTTILANIDVTNRCNMKCPICFANASVSGRLYEPSLDEIEKMLRILREEKPVPCPAIQFSGGEPTVREDLPQIFRIASSLGFSQIQVATNGIKMANSVDYCMELKKAGLKTVYLQFDGLTPDSYIKTRGFNALPIKLRAIENMRKGGLKSVVLVPTLAKGVNDDQMGAMIDFAFENSDVVRCINVQPISFAGRVEAEELHNMRITIPDFFKLVEEQTDGQITRHDFYPVPFVVPVSRFIEAWKNEEYVEFTVHPHCGAGTYLFKKGERIIPITQFFDVEGMLEYIEEQIDEVRKGRIGKAKSAVGLLAKLHTFVDNSKAPEGVNPYKLLYNVLTRGDFESTAEFHRNTIFLGVMHFQDAYNFDVERVCRCGIHYALPDGRVVPFCTYNTLYREEFEKRYSRPL